MIDLTPPGAGFPRFMEGVEAVKQVDETTLHWQVDIGGQKREWTANITELLELRLLVVGGTHGYLDINRFFERRRHR